MMWSDALRAPAAAPVATPDELSKLTNSLSRRA
jgi:hypothetical protein